jgi:hypothetical protein
VLRTLSRPRLGSEARWFLASLPLVALVGLVVARAAAPSPTVLVWMIGVTLAAPLVYRLATGTFDPFEPLVWFLLAWLVMFVIHPAAMIVDRDVFFHDSYRLIDLSSTFDQSLQLGLGGALAFLVAYFMPIGRILANRWRRPPANVSWDVLIPGAMLTGLIGILLGIAWLHSAGESPLALFAGRAARTNRALILAQNGSSYLLHGPYLLIPAGLILITAARIRRDRTIGAIGCGFAILAILRAIALGDRAMLLPIVGGLLIFSYLRRDRRPSFVAFLGVIVLFLYVATIIGDTRTADYRAQHSVLSAVVQATIQPSHDLATLTHSNDSAEIRTLAGALLYVPSQIPYKYGGATLGDVLTRPIPRTFWAGKPQPPAQQALRLMIPESFQAGSSNKAASSVLVFYMDGGLLGVIAGMAVYGAFSRAMYEYYRRWPANVFSQIMLALFTALMASAMRDGFADTIERMILVMGPVWVIYRAASLETLQRFKRGGRKAGLPTGAMVQPWDADAEWQPNRHGA